LFKNGLLPLLEKVRMRVCSMEGSLLIYAEVELGLSLMTTDENPKRNFDVVGIKKKGSL
jgi:hypothetical protein